VTFYPIQFIKKQANTIVFPSPIILFWHFFLCRPWAVQQESQGSQCAWTLAGLRLLFQQKSKAEKPEWSKKGEEKQQGAGRRASGASSSGGTAVSAPKAKQAEQPPAEEEEEDEGQSIYHFQKIDNLEEFNNQSITPKN